MALNARTRRWLAAASDEALRVLAAEVERLAQELTESRSAAAQADRQRHDDLAALRERVEATEGAMRDLPDEIAAIRAEVSALRSDVDALFARVETKADENAGQLTDLGARLDRGETAIEVVRTRVAGLAEQWRWDGDDLRKAISALVERTEQRS